MTVTATGTAPVFTSVAAPAATFGVAYSYTFTATASPIPNFAVQLGRVPSGLTLCQTEF
jgi:hypothetical protein